MRACSPAKGASFACRYNGWASGRLGIKNGKLLALAAASFDAFVTVDKNLPYQQNTASLPITVLVLDAVSNELTCLLPLVPALERELSNLAPGRYVFVKTEA